MRVDAGRCGHFRSAADLVPSNHLSGHRNHLGLKRAFRGARGGAFLFLAQSFSWQGLGASERDTPRRIWSNSSGERVIYLAEVTSGVESPGTPPMKLSDGEEEDLGEAARRKPSLGNLTSSNNSTSTSDNNAHLDPIAEDMMKTKKSNVTKGVEWAAVQAAKDVMDAQVAMHAKVPIWYESVINVVRIWYQSGTNLVPIWHESGTNLVQM